VPLIRESDAPRFSVPGVDFTAYAAPSRGSAEICTWQITVDVGADSAPHTLDRDEVFFVLSGAIRLDPESEVLGPQDVAVVPAGEPIQLTNAGEVPAQVYVAIRSGFTATTADGQVLRPPWAQ
jgi:mannose-6-phosphate isomerase-like protein (cupin superfamily)